MSTSEKFSRKIGDRCERHTLSKMMVWPRKEVKNDSMWAICKILPLTQYWAIFTFLWCLCLYAVDLLSVFLYYFPNSISANLTKFDWNSKTNEALKGFPTSFGVSLCRTKGPKTLPNTRRECLADLKQPDCLKSRSENASESLAFWKFPKFHADL